MIYSQKFLASKLAQKLPPAIRTHSVWTTSKKIYKIFPKLGLNNTIEMIDSPTGRCGIAFSSDMITGLWDLATMAMRGTSSCQHWNNRHSNHLIGSMVDPFCGIMYLTDGTINEYGLMMHRRCLVRMIVNYNTGARHFMLERLYKTNITADPYQYNNRDEDPGPTIRLFKNFINEKTNNRFITISSQDLEPENYQLRINSFIPYHPQVESIHPNDRSLIDSGIGYDRSPHNNDIFNLLTA